VGKHVTLNVADILKDGLMTQCDSSKMCVCMCVCVGGVCLCWCVSVLTASSQYYEKRLIFLMSVCLSAAM